MGWDSSVYFYRLSFVLLCLCWWQYNITLTPIIQRSSPPQSFLIIIDKAKQGYCPRGFSGLALSSTGGHNLKTVLSLLRNLPTGFCSLTQSALGRCNHTESLLFPFTKWRTMPPLFYPIHSELWWYRRKWYCAL